jgi:hypothetical protein
MATISISNDFDVADKYEILVQQSLSGNSAYIRAKETIQELMDSGAIDDAQKADIISKVIGAAVNGITTSSMSGAIQWASAEKDFGLRKLETELKLDILANEVALTEAQAEQANNTVRLSKVESRRMHGVATFSGNTLLTLNDSGKVYTDMQLVDAQKSKIPNEIELLSQKVTESEAAVHKIVADTYVNYGNYTYTQPTSTGIATITPQHGAYVTLSNTQQEIAKEQAKGYTYNAWANALTGSASMLGTAMAAEYAEFEAGQPGAVLLETILDAAENLKNATSSTASATPTA